MKIEYILLACDNHPKFLSFLPSVAYHWKSMGYKVAFGLVTESLSAEMESYIRSFVDDLYIHYYDSKTSYPPIVLTKLFRFYISRFYPHTTVCVQDIDYYVFDKHEHIEKLIRNPSKEVLTHGFNAYVGDVEPHIKHTLPHFWMKSSAVPYIEIPYAPGIEPGSLVFNKYGNVGTSITPTHTLLREVPRLFELRFPATPMVAHGSLIYQIFSKDTEQTFDDFLNELYSRQKTFTPPSMSGGSSSFDHVEFSDETLILQLNRSNGVVYHHTKRDDFVSGIAMRRIDPRRTSNENQWVPNSNGESIRSLMENRYIIDIQPHRPLQASAIMNVVFDFLKIPFSLNYINATLHGTERDTDV